MSDKKREDMSDRELLIRIDERTETHEKRLDGLSSKLNAHIESDEAHGVKAERRATGRLGTITMGVLSAFGMFIGLLLALKEFRAFLAVFPK
ncbi:MAG: hypothetical protein QME60_01255 [Verrucomicrobiota bacterium]|nr:hypothetical protein [Verrucomicrobiota bacterium]